MLANVPETQIRHATTETALPTSGQACFIATTVIAMKTYAGLVSARGIAKTPSTGSALGPDLPQVTRRQISLVPGSYCI